MFSLDVKTDARGFDRVRRETDNARRRILTHRADAVARTAQESIVVSDEPSRPGEPPHTRGKSGQNIRDAIQYDVNNEDAIVGTSASMIGELGAAFEMDEPFHGDDLDARPFMLPALEENIDSFLNDFDGAIGE